MRLKTWQIFDIFLLLCYNTWGEGGQCVEQLDGYLDFAPVFSQSCKTKQTNNKTKQTNPRAQHNPEAVAFFIPVIS